MVTTAKKKKKKPVVIIALAEQPATSLWYDSVTLRFYGPLPKESFKEVTISMKLTCQLFFDKNSLITCEFISRLFFFLNHLNIYHRAFWTQELSISRLHTIQETGIKNIP